MSALVKGMENGMREALIEVGGLERVQVEPQELPAHQRHLDGQKVGITMNDVKALKQSASLVKVIVPEMRLSRPTLSRSNKVFNPFVVSGTWPNALELNQHVVAHGRMFNDIDDEMARNVCVIGTATRDELFGSPEDTGREIIPVGEQVNINGQLFTIIGMFKHYESEQQRKIRELEKSQTKPVESGPSRSRGWAGVVGVVSFSG